MKRNEKKQTIKTAAFNFNKEAVIDFLSSHKCWDTLFNVGSTYGHGPEIFEEMGFGSSEIKAITTTPKFGNGHLPPGVDTSDWLFWFAERLGISTNNNCPPKGYTLPIPAFVRAWDSLGIKMRYDHERITSAHYLRTAVLQHLINDGAIIEPTIAGNN